MLSVAQPDFSRDHAAHVRNGWKLILSRLINGTGFLPTKGMETGK
jgi:hypothetical protein